MTNQNKTNHRNKLYGFFMAIWLCLWHHIFFCIIEKVTVDLNYILLLLLRHLFSSCLVTLTTVARTQDNHNLYLLAASDLLPLIKCLVRHL